MLLSFSNFFSYYEPLSNCITGLIAFINPAILYDDVSYDFWGKILGAIIFIFGVLEFNVILNDNTKLNYMFQVMLFIVDLFNLILKSIYSINGFKKFINIFTLIITLIIRYFYLKIKFDWNIFSSLKKKLSFYEIDFTIDSIFTFSLGIVGIIFPLVFEDDLFKFNSQGDIVLARQLFIYIFSLFVLKLSFVFFANLEEQIKLTTIFVFLEILLFSVLTTLIIEQKIMTTLMIIFFSLNCFHLIIKILFIIGIPKIVFRENLIIMNEIEIKSPI